MTTTTTGHGDVVTLRKDGGIALDVMSLGATWLGCTVPVGGVQRQVLLGRQSAREPLAQAAYLGATIGRYANRISEASLRGDGGGLRLVPNPGSRHQLHGGPEGFDKRIWKVESRSDHEASFTLTSPDGDQGFQGELDVRVTYRLLDALTIEMVGEARTTRPTPVCLTNHAYFNLEATHRDVREHVLRIAADRYLPVDRDLIPIGHLDPVTGTNFDFREGKTLARDWLRDEQQQAGAGYDHAFLLDSECAAMQRPACVLSARDGSLAMEMSTTLPSLQVYGGQYLGGLPSRDGTPYAACAGIALEPQFLPDSPNHPEWPQPSCWLEPGQVYRQVIRWRFLPRG
jgi:aldose 1-epimerase